MMSYKNELPSLHKVLRKALLGVLILSSVLLLCGTVDMQTVSKKQKKYIKPISKITPEVQKILNDMRRQGITRLNFKKKDIHKLFSNQFVQIDSTGYLRLYIHMKNMDQSKLDSLRSWRVEVEYVEQGFARAVCRVPFDIVEQISKLEFIIQINGVARPITNVGQ